jgi:hypothetical protein
MESRRSPFPGQETVTKAILPWYLAGSGIINIVKKAFRQHLIMSDWWLESQTGFVSSLGGFKLGKEWNPFLG